MLQGLPTLRARQAEVHALQLDQQLALAALQVRSFPPPFHLAPSLDLI